MRGRRRVWFAIAAVVAALVAGRWTALFVTERLWEARVGEAAAVVGTRFALLSAGLELAGLVVAIAWFIGHYLWVTRSVLLQFGDQVPPLGRFPERTIYLVATGLGLILGVAVGGGTGAWLGPLLLNLQGVRFGVVDPLLQVDLGVYAAALPVWELLLGRAFGLALPALLGVLVVAVMGGALRIAERRLWLARPLRVQVALLVTLVAVLLGWDSLLEPYRLAAARPVAVGPAEFLLRSTVAQVVALIALTAAVLSALWAIRFRFVVALAGWVGLGLAVLGGTILVQSRAQGDSPGADAIPLRTVDSIAFGAAWEPSSPTGGPKAASLWDRDVLVRLLAGPNHAVNDAWPGTAVVGNRDVRVWYLVREPAGGGDPALIAVADDRIGPSGGVASLRWGDDGFSPGVVPLVTMSRHHARPGAPALDLDRDAAGVPLWSNIRRIAVAWALQTGDALRAASDQKIAWRLDPVERLTAVAPFASWSRPRPALIGRDLYWVSTGFQAVTAFPASRTVGFEGRDVGYLRPGFVGLVRAQGGATRIFLRAGADSLAAAWARIASPLVEPAAALPGELDPSVGMAAPEAAIIAQVLQGPAWLDRQVAVLGRQTYPVELRSDTGTPDDPFLVPLLARGGEQRVTGLLRLPGPGRRPALLQTDSTLELATPRDLQQRWDRFPFFQQLRDSIRASGAEFVPGLIRFDYIGDSLVAYQPNFAISGDGVGGLALVNVALGSRLGAGRTLGEAWQNLRGEVSPLPVGSDLGARIDEARRWLDQADSALRRGDLLEFGRAFGYLRELLKPTGPPPESRP